MSDYDFNSELDAILAQFNSDTNEPAEAPAVPETPSTAEDYVKQQHDQLARRKETERRQKQAELEKQQAEEQARQKEEQSRQIEELKRLKLEEQKKQRLEQQKLEQQRRREEAERARLAALSEEDDEDDDDDDNEDDVIDDEEDFYDDDDYDTAAHPYRTKKPKGFKRFLLGSLGTVFAVVSLFLLVWLGINVHPDTQISSAAGTSSTKTTIVTRLDTYSNNAKVSALGDLASYKKKYVIAEDALVAPTPIAECYGEVPVSNAAAIMDLIQQARDSGLLGEDEAVVFDPNADFYDDGSNIRYYYDETILVILWKELIDGRICSNVEVKIADASQFRRKLADDSFQTAVQYNCSQLADSANAVVAMNADFFAFRDYGISVYQRQVYRDNPNMVDTCYITTSGDMIYSLKGELSTMEEAQNFVDENNVLFSMAFGPILVYDGVVQHCDTYPMGEIDQEYSRAGIGQVDSLHYLYMTVNHAVEGGYPRCNVNEFAEIFASQNVKTAYNLDGGQTSEINIRGEMYNRVDWGNERPVSDIIYFATALGEEAG